MKKAYTLNANDFLYISRELLPEILEYIIEKRAYFSELWHNLRIEHGSEPVRHVGTLVDRWESNAVVTDDEGRRWQRSYFRASRKPLPEEVEE